MGFVHLHLHTEYSLLDGACRIGELMDAVSALGQTAVACTDHGVMYGAIDFYKAAKQKGIKPIIGCEVYVAKRTRFDKVHELDSENRHLVLLCENETGYRNLIAMVSKAWLEGFYNRPRVDFELLKEHHEGLIALSACLAGEIPRALSANDYQGAKEAALNYLDIFGDGNFFLELQDHNLDEQHYVNPQIIRMSRETGIPLVVTNDCHYLRKSDSKMHHVLMCIQTGRTIDDKDGLEFGSDEFYLKSEEEMRGLFPELPQAADNTVLIADRCSLDFEFGKTKLPRFDTPDNSDSEEFFIKICREGVKERYGDDPPAEVLSRLKYETDMISQMGYVNYYLIVWDFVRYAKSVGIPVGPGRGSGVGSLAAYVMGITGIDPIEHGLMFERFLNPERVSMPDFDIDFSDERRGEMIDYVIERYGEDHVAQIVTFGTMAARGAVRDVARAMAVPYAKADRIAKLIPMRLGVTLKDVLGADKDSGGEFRELYDSDSQVREVVDMAVSLEGMPRHASTHAAGVLITDKPVMHYMPLAKNDDAVVTQYTMTAVEALGLLKMDFLGLRYLSVIENAVKRVRKSNESFSIEKIDLHDKKTYAMLSAGHTEGIFQFESAGMTRLTMQSVPKNIEDLTAVVSLYRPGPMQFIPMYLESRRNPEKVTYKHERLKNILDVTGGCIIYQEQVMQIFRELAGYSLGRADVVRRAMSKKKHDVLEMERRAFIYGEKNIDGSIIVEGCVNRGVDEHIAAELFDEIGNFASYAFNKSHGAAYALLVYQTAYLKCHYPTEYMAALLSSVLGSTDKVAEYMAECQRMDISVLPPRVNFSKAGFTVTGKNIRFGLLAVKNLGRSVIERLVSDREQNGQYRSFYDFCKRNTGRDLNRRALESLIKCGALDDLGNNRREMFLAVEDVLGRLDSEKRNNIEGQLELFGMVEEKDGASASGDLVIEPAPDFSSEEKMAMEKEVTGIYISGHPMAVYRKQYESGRYARIDEIRLCAAGESELYKDNEEVSLLVIVDSFKRKETKNGSVMAFAMLEDMYGSMECLIFPKVLEKYGSMFASEAALSVSGRLSFIEEKEPQLICEEVSYPDKADKAENKNSNTDRKRGLYLRVGSMNDPKYLKAMQYIEIFDGQEELYLLFSDTGKVMRAPAKFRVQINKPLLNALEELLGAENVVYKP